MNKIEIDEKIKILKDNLPLVQKKYNVKTLGIFGSYIRGEQNENSDLDVLVEFDEPISLFEFMDLEEYLGEAVGIKVDLVSRKALKPRIGKHILEEVIDI